MKAVLTACLLCTVLATPAAAQGRRPRPARPVLEHELRQRVAEKVQRELKLDSAQMHKLRAMTDRLAPRRKALAQQTHAATLALRAEVARGHDADQQHIARLNSQLADLQRKRFELQQDEEHELGTFLTPLQQAKYLGLQAQLRKQVQQFQGDQETRGKAADSKDSNK